MRAKANLSVKITIVISITLLITLGSSAIFIFNYISDMTLMNLVEVTSLKAESISKDITNIFENAKLATDYMGMQSHIKTYLKEVETREEIAKHHLYDEVTNILIDIAESNDRYFLTWIANEKANFYIDHLGNIPEDDYDVLKRPWYSYAMAAEGVALTPPYIEWITRRVVISSIEALRENGKVYGFVVVDIVLEDVPGMLQLMKQGDNDISYLITGDGTYVYTPELDKIVEKNMFDKEDAFHLYEKEIKSASGQLIPIEMDGQPYYLVSHSVDERGWIIVTLIDAKRVEEEVRDSGLLIVLILIGTIVAVMYLVYVLVKLTTKPYTLLVDYGRDVAEGHLSKNIPDKYLKRFDEMGALSNSFQSIINTFRNINKTLEDEIIRKNQELESQFELIVEQEKYASLGLVVTGIAHEINTPIGNALSVSTFLENKAMKLKTKYEQGLMSKDDFIEFQKTEEQSLSLLIESLENATKIIENFKMISLNHSNETKRKFSIYNVLSAVSFSLKSEYVQSKHKIDINCDENIVINSYSSALSQVITHLVMNSLKHGFKTLEEGWIQMTVKNLEDDIEICYQDNGCGMTSENIEKMYIPFYTTERGKGASGLGMYIVFNLISQKLGGTIQYTGEPNKGMKFIIVLPKNIE
ncbi:MAG: sensor histidine kinase [Clostridiales bacterium]|nr:sensor histidine kinase [Clostridiales bacterium]